VKRTLAARHGRVDPKRLTLSRHAHSRFWHGAADSECPLFGRYWG
jgi:hypothetical protein